MKRSNAVEILAVPGIPAPCVTSRAEKAWMCISGTTALIAWQIASYVAPV